MKSETIKIDELNMKENINGIMVLIEKSWLIKNILMLLLSYKHGLILVFMLGNNKWGTTLFKDNSQ